MKMAALAGMAVLAGTGLHGQTVAVYVADDVGIRSCQLYVAKHRAADILAAAAVRIAWQTGKPHELEGGRPIAVRIISNRPKYEHPGALAFALVYEGTHITILYERVRAAMPETPEVELAYVLAHEITHILESVCRHSDTGS